MSKALRNPISLGSPEKRAASPRADSGFYFPSLGIYFMSIQKNASTSTMSTLVRLEESLSQQQYDLEEVTNYVDVPEHTQVRPWHNFRSISLSYQAGLVSDYMELARHRLVILRNPVERLISGWVNKFFMAESVQEEETEDIALTNSPKTEREIVNAFNAFVGSLKTLPQNTFQTGLDGHLLPQSSFVSAIDAYNIVAGIDDLEATYQKLGLIVPAPVHARSEGIARLNTSPEDVSKLLLASADVESISGLYQEDYRLIEVASARFPHLVRQLDHKIAARPSASFTLSTEVSESLVRKRLTYQTAVAPKKKKERNKRKPIPVAIYLLCHNERVLLPHAVEHYRSRIPQAQITILDNESTDGSVEIAQELGCRVRSWASGNHIDDHLFVKLKNEIWKSRTEGWAIVADMDEWLCVTSLDLKDAARRGATILRTYGWNIVAESQREDLADLDLHALTRGFHMRSRDKLVAFRPSLIKEMNFGIGAHESQPVGSIVFSPRTYLLKHMERLGKPWLRAKFLQRTARAERMHAMGIAQHYTNDIEKIDQRQDSAVASARHFPADVLKSTWKRKLKYALKLVRYQFQTIQRYK